MPAHSGLPADGFVKHDLADRLRREIIKGSLPGGVRIIEGKWAQKFGVAQGSVREPSTFLRGTDSSPKNRDAARELFTSASGMSRTSTICGALSKAWRLAWRPRPIRTYQNCRRRWTVCDEPQTRASAKTYCIATCNFTCSSVNSRGNPTLWNKAAELFCPFLLSCA